jgi:hypothetical protein
MPALLWFQSGTMRVRGEGGCWGYFVGVGGYSGGVGAAAQTLRDNVRMPKQPPDLYLVIGLHPDAVHRQGFRPQMSALFDALARAKALEIRTLQSVVTGKHSLGFVSITSMADLRLGGYAIPLPLSEEATAALYTLLVRFGPEQAAKNRQPQLKDQLQRCPGVRYIESRSEEEDDAPIIEVFQPDPDAPVGIPPAEQLRQLIKHEQLRQLIKQTIRWKASSAELTNIAVLDSGCRSEDKYKRMDGKGGVVASSDHGSQVADTIQMLLPNSKPAVWKVTEGSKDWFTKDVTSEYVKALRAVRDPKCGIRVVNVSRGHAEWTMAERAEIEQLEQEGILMVAAAGNSSSTVHFPAGYETVICVGAVKFVEDESAPVSRVYNWEIWEKSCAGYDLVNLRCLNRKFLAVDVVAPGVRIPVPGWKNPLSGTSFAAPMVSALAGLLFSLQPDLTPNDVRMILRGTSQPHPSGHQAYGWGLIDWEKAVSQLPWRPGKMSYHTLV